MSITDHGLVVAGTFADDFGGNVAVWLPEVRPDDLPPGAADGTALPLPVDGAVCCEVGVGTAFGAAPTRQLRIKARSRNTTNMITVAVVKTSPVLVPKADCPPPAPKAPTSPPPRPRCSSTMKIISTLMSTKTTVRNVLSMNAIPENVAPPKAIPRTHGAA